MSYPIEVVVEGENGGETNDNFERGFMEKDG